MSHEENAGGKAGDDPLDAFRDEDSEVDPPVDAEDARRKGGIPDDAKRRRGEDAADD